MLLNYDFKVSVGGEQTIDDYEWVGVSVEHDLTTCDVNEFVKYMEYDSIQSLLKFVLGEQDYIEWEVDDEIKHCQESDHWYAIERFLLDFDKDCRRNLEKFMSRKLRDKAIGRLLSGVVNLTENGDYDYDI